MDLAHSDISIINTVINGNSMHCLIMPTIMNKIDMFRIGQCK